MDERAFILLITLLSLPVLTLIGYYITEIIKAKNGGKNTEKLEHQVKALLEENKSLQKRLSNIETIVIEDKDIYLPPRNEATKLAEQIEKLAKEK